MAQQIDLFIDSQDVSEYTPTNELRLLAQLNSIKSTAASIDKPADPDIVKTKKKVSVQAKQDSATENGSTTTAASSRTTTTSNSNVWKNIDWQCFFQNPTNYLLMLIAFLLFINLIIHD
jgi:hypothetical protein